VNRLAGDAEGITDLFPRPSALPGEADAACLDLLGEPVQRADCAQADRGVI
jgi:hypothetical protein